MPVCAGSSIEAETSGVPPSGRTRRSPGTSCRTSATATPARVSPPAFSPPGFRCGNPTCRVKAAARPRRSSRRACARRWWFLSDWRTGRSAHSSCFPAMCRMPHSASLSRRSPARSDSFCAARPRKKSYARAEPSRAPSSPLRSIPSSPSTPRAASWSGTPRPSALLAGSAKRS